jgi:hypothetical protein
MSNSPSRNGRKPPQIDAPTEYADVQKGTLLVDVLSVSSALTVISTIVRPHIIETIALLLQLATLVCVCTLFIRVKDGYLMWQYGPGWIRGKVALSDIESSQIVTSRLAYGWSYRRDKRNWNFNRQGATVLEILYCGGKRLGLGTSRAAELRHIIENAPERRNHGSSC